MRYKSTELMGTIKAFVEDYYKKSRHSPSTTQIADAVGIVRGTVSCGVPTLEEEYAEEYVSLPVSMFGNGTFFILRANGESMIDAEIAPGDFVLVRKQSEAMDGDIVVALVGNENTLKRYFVDTENKQIRLHPENKTMKDIEET